VASNSRKILRRYNSARRSRTLRTLTTAAIGALTSISRTHAATATWIGTTDSNWATNTNWSPATAPGSTSSTTNTDTAIFNNAGNSQTAVTIDPNRNVNDIIFDTSSAAPYMFSGGSLLGTNGGEILLTPTETQTQSFTTPLTIESAKGVFSLINNSSSTAASINYSGNITAANGALFLSGTNTGQNSIAGNITGTCDVIQQSSGVWTLSGSDTYSGPTYVVAGTMKIPNSLAGTNSLNAYGGTVQISGSVSPGSLTASFGGSIILNGNGQVTTSTAFFPQNGGTTTLDNTSTLLNNRLHGIGLPIASGTLNYLSGNGASSEQVGTIITEEGDSTINLQPNSSGSTIFNAASINRDVSSVQANGILVVVAPKLGSAPAAGVANMLIAANATAAAPIGGGGPAGSTNISIENFIFDRDTSLAGNAQYGLVTGIGTANGIRALTPSEYTSSIADGADNIATLNNANLTSASTVIGHNTTVNAVRLDTGGAITGSGTLSINSGVLLALAGNSGVSVADLNFPSTEAVLNTVGDLTVTGNITGAAGLTKSGQGTLVLSSASPLSYTGRTAVNNGVLRFGAANQLSTQYPIALTGGSIDLNGFNESLPLGGGVYGGSNSTIFNSNNSTTPTLTIDQAATLSTRFRGTIGAPGENQFALNLDTGTSGFFLCHANSYSGPTTMTSGIAILDFSQPDSPASNIIPAASHVTCGGNIQIVQNAAPASQTFAGLTMNPGPGSLSEIAPPQADPAAFLNLASLQVNFGLLNRNIGGVAEIFPGSNGSGFITSASNTNGIIGGWSCINAQDWSVANGAGDIAPLSTYTSDTWSAGANVDVTVSSGPINATANSLHFAVAGNDVLTLTGTCILTSGGILVGRSVGAHRDTIQSGTLEGAAGGDLVANIFNSGANSGLEIDSVIADNTSATALTLAGGGTLTLTGANTYTGPTYIDSGILKIASNNNLGSPAQGAPVYLESGMNSILAVSNTFALDNAGSNPRGIVLGGLGGDIDVAPSKTLTVDGIVSGSQWGRITLNDTGTLVLSNPANTFAGTLSGGSVVIANTTAAQYMTVQNNTSLNFAPAVFHYYLGGLAGSSSVNLTDQAHSPITLTVGGNNQDTTYTGSLTLGTSFIKVGTGTTTISGFVLGASPNFTINAGTLQFMGQSSMGNASILNNSLLEFTAGATGVGYVITGNGTMNVASPVQIEMTTVNQNAVINNGYLRMDRGGAFGPLSGTGTLGIGVGTISGTVALGASTGLSTVGALSLENASVLDVQNNRLLIHYAATPDPISTVAAMLASGYANGAWNGPGINSSTAAANFASYGLGYADSADPGNPAGLSSGNIEIAYTLLGDANLDLAVNGVDFGILAANFNHTVSRWDQGDFNYDNIVNGVDFGELAANFNKGATGASGPPALSDPALVAFAQANGLMADVPEPACGALTALAVIGTLAPRRRSRRNNPD
jgi:fibronectin-binding autotransporter adhesin